MTKKEPTVTIVPNIERIFIRLIQQARLSSIIMPGQLKAGEALHCGEVVDPGDTKFKVGQVVYYSEYSASQIYNIGAALRGECSLGEAMQSAYYIVAADDVMAYEKEVFNWEKEGIVKQQKEMKQPVEYVSATGAIVAHDNK